MVYLSLVKLLLLIYIALENGPFHRDLTCWLVTLRLCPPPPPCAWPSRPHFSHSVAVGCFILFLYFEDRLLDLLMSSSIFLVSNSLIRLYLYPSCSRGFTLLFCFPSSCRMFTVFIISLACSVVKAFRVVNSPPGPPEASSTGVWPLSPGRL